MTPEEQFEKWCERNVRFLGLRDRNISDKEVIKKAFIQGYNLGFLDGKRHEYAGQLLKEKSNG